MGRNGECPTCGRVIVEAPPPGDDATAANEHAAAPVAPWHFKLMLVALVIYLGYRAFQGVEWLIGHL
jgi:uracil-DNA glycosylase